jgi:hypothetical protein
MSRKSIVAAVVVALAITSASLWAWRGHAESPGHDKPAEASREPDGEAGVTLTPEARERAGIQTTDVRAGEMQAPALAIAMALPLQELIDAASSIAAAQAQAERAQAALDASRRDHERVRGLHALDRNASDRALESAEAAWRADEASAWAAAATLQSARASARARWGQTLADSMVKRGSLWLALESGRQALLRVAPGAGAASVTMPVAINVELPSGQPAKAHLISPSPATDPRIQGPAYLYAMEAREASTGQALQARYAAGARESGAVLPADALLWWQGKQWAYVEEAPGRFERREAPSARRIEGGWFVPGFKPAKVASRGAQSLLAQELRSAIQVGEDEK